MGLALFSNDFGRFGLGRPGREAKRVGGRTQSGTQSRERNRRGAAGANNTKNQGRPWLSLRSHSTLSKMTKFDAEKGSDKAYDEHNGVTAYTESVQISDRKLSWSVPHPRLLATRAR